jgi:hypothetical protein
MKRKTISLLIFAGLLAIGLQFFWVSPVFASTGSSQAAAPTPPPQPVQTQLVISSQTDANLGDSFVVVGTLKDKNGVGIPDKEITFSISGDYLGQAPTQNDGTFSIRINKDLPAGTFSIVGSFVGAHLIAPSSATDILTIHPAKVQVQTIPPVAGITFQMDGRKFLSDANGMGTIEISKTGVYRLEVLIDQYQTSAEKVTFGRWSEESYDPSRDVRVPTSEVIQVGLNTFHQISEKFVDLDGYPVDPQRISGITIKSLQGDIFNLKQSQPIWIPASRVARRSTGLEQTNLLYSVIAVLIDGSNVVNQAQQRFFAAENDTWTISLLLYSLHIDAKDGLFGAPVGKTVEVQFPDGQKKSYPLDKSGSVEIHSLARGIYTIDLTGTNGLDSKIPVALSRNQDVAVNVVTYLDLGVVGGISLLFAIGLVIYGRPWLLHRKEKNKVLVTEEARWTSIHEN